MASESDDDAHGDMDGLLPSGEAFRLSGHEDKIFSLLVHPHFPLLVSGAKDRTLRVWDIETRCCLRTLAGHTSTVWGLALDPAGRRLASGSGDRTVRLWDLDSGACLHTLDGHALSYVRAVAWNTTGALIASGSDDSSVRVWDAASGVLRHTLTGHRSHVYALAAHPFADLLASGSKDRTVRVWRWSSGSIVFVIEDRDGYIRSLAASEAWLVSASFNATVRVWSWASGACERTLDSTSVSFDLNSVSWRDSRLVFLESDGTVREWDTSSEDPRAWSCVGSLASEASSAGGVVISERGLFCTAPSDVRSIAVWEV